MITSKKAYINHLKKALSGCDRAIVQDAIADAEEYLFDTLKSMEKEDPEIDEPEAIRKIIETYGTPEEVALAYKRIELNTSPYGDKAKDSQIISENKEDPSPQIPIQKAKRKWYKSFFGIMAQPRAWGSLLYLLLLLPLGIIYFTWAITGISLSVGLIVLIVGLPFMWLFLLSVRGLALMEGKLVEALVGIRMPRRQVFSNKSLNFWGRLKNQLGDKYTWLSLIYLIICLPLGIFYSSIIISLVAVSLYLIATPVLNLVFHWPLFIDSGFLYYLPVWLMPFAVIAGILLIFGIMHLVKVLGTLQGRLAKVMLVRPNR